MKGRSGRRLFRGYSEGHHLGENNSIKGKSADLDSYGSHSLFFGSDSWEDLEQLFSKGQVRHLVHISFLILLQAPSQ